MTARFPWAAYWVLLALIAVFAMLPILTTIVSGVVADAYGCTVNEAYASPCPINGTDYGYWLQFGGMSVLYLFVTWPIAFVFFLIWLIVLLMHRAAFKRRSVAA